MGVYVPRSISIICAGSNVSLYVTVDPRRPLNLPQLKFLGPEHGMYMYMDLY